MDKSNPPDQSPVEPPTQTTQAPKPAVDGVSGAGSARDEAGIGSSPPGAPAQVQHEAASDPAPTQPPPEAGVDTTQDEARQASAQSIASDRPSWISAHPRPLRDRVDKDRLKSLAVRGTKVAAIVFSAWFTVVLFLIAVYSLVNPPFSSLMVMKWVSGTSIHRQWAPIEKISPHLVRAVIASEDGRFCQHWGIDFGELAAAIKRTARGTPRGASTITMQVAKNLFLWPAKSYVRKVIEVPLTYAIELMWSKRRIMEVYLNIAEWGPGVFGAEAAAREHFGRSAARLSRRQSARLAVALPNPLKRDAGDPGPWTRRRATIIQRRAARSPEEATCVLGGD
jgi:monofunctional biosynthetic peptidoglycan transglycosylase